MRAAVMLLATPVLTLCAAACVPAAGPRGRMTWEDRRAVLLKERAAFDLQCAKDQLRIQPLGNEYTMGVAGCARRAVYLYDYQHDAWFMNGAIDDDRGGAPGAELATPSSSARVEDASR